MGNDKVTLRMSHCEVRVFREEPEVGFSKAFMDYRLSVATGIVRIEDTVGKQVCGLHKYNTHELIYFMVHTEP